MNEPGVSVESAGHSQLLRKEGNRLLQLGQPQAALDSFERALTEDANNALTLTDRGNALQQLRRFDEAVASYQRALALKPQSVAALVNRSNALRALGRLQEALPDLDSALRLKPDLAEAHNNRGNLLRDLGRLEEALASFDQALAFRSEFALAHGNRGKLLLDLNRPRAALASFEATLRHAPQDGEAIFGCASALLQLGERLEQAAAQFERAAALGIERAETLVGRAAALAGQQRHGEAAGCVVELLRIAPQWDYARGSLLHSRLQCADWTDLSMLTRELCEQVRQGRKATHPHALLALSDSPQLHLTCARAVVADKYAEERSGCAWPCAGSVDRQRAAPVGRIRVAYVSADFRDHPVSQLLVRTLEQHDRESFEIIGVSLRQGQGGAFEQRLRAAFDRFVEVAERSDREIASLLRTLAVDIAVDLTGFTAGLRLGIFAQRAAPLQVSYLGYPSTMGAPYMDYLIADEVVIPRGEEQWFDEHIVRLPHCYLPNDDRREVARAPTRAAAGLPESGFVFCVFTNAYKINPQTFDVWMRLLAAIEGSVLWLKDTGPQARENLVREAEVRGIDAARLLFAPPVASAAEHLGRQVLADLYLDTLPYNAHSTACEALWAGLPVLTCTGHSMASRAAASALMAAGLPELITHSLAGYERRALELARRPAELAALRTRLAASRERSALFDTARYTRRLEAAYLRMQERAARGEAPQGFTVDERSVAHA